MKLNQITLINVLGGAGLCYVVPSGARCPIGDGAEWVIEQGVTDPDDMTFVRSVESSLAAVRALPDEDAATLGIQLLRAGLADWADHD